MAPHISSIHIFLIRWITIFFMIAFLKLLSNFSLEREKPLNVFLILKKDISKFETPLISAADSYLSL